MNTELKDYFAGKAMQGLLSSGLSIDEIVMTSYNIAQKMIEHKHKLLTNNVVTTSKQTAFDNIENL